jgi:hypothetical protein
MGLPQRLGGWKTCPVCESNQISWKCLYHDPHYIYTPQTRNGKVMVAADE